MLFPEPESPLTRISCMTLTSVHGARSACKWEKALRCSETLAAALHGRLLACHEFSRRVDPAQLKNVVAHGSLEQHR